MDIDLLLANLRRQYGVSAKFAKSLRPLLESAARSPAAKRDRLRGIVERSFAVEARTQGAVKRIRLAEDRLKPNHLLLSVAELLHGWKTY